jgi:hypothetical protein
MCAFGAKLYGFRLGMNSIHDAVMAEKQTVTILAGAADDSILLLLDKLNQDFRVRFNNVFKVNLLFLLTIVLLKHRQFVLQSYLNFNIIKYQEIRS